MVFLLLVYIYILHFNNLETSRTRAVWQTSLSCFMVPSSRAIDKDCGSNDNLLPVLILAVIFYFKGLGHHMRNHKFFCQMRNNSEEELLVSYCIVK